LAQSFKHNYIFKAITSHETYLLTSDTNALQGRINRGFAS